MESNSLIQLQLNQQVHATEVQRFYEIIHHIAAAPLTLKVCLPSTQSDRKPCIHGSESGGFEHAYLHAH